MHKELAAAALLSLHACRCLPMHAGNSKLNHVLSPFQGLRSYCLLDVHLSSGSKLMLFNAQGQARAKCEWQGAD